MTSNTYTFSIACRTEYLFTSPTGSLSNRTVTYSYGRCVCCTLVQLLAFMTQFLFIDSPASQDYSWGTSAYSKPKLSPASNQSRSPRESSIILHAAPVVEEKQPDYARSGSFLQRYSSMPFLHTYSFFIPSFEQEI